MRNNLIEFRHKLGLTQEEIAYMFHKNRCFWSFLESGQRKGEPEMWIDLGIKFNLTLKQIKKLMEVIK